MLIKAIALLFLAVWPLGNTEAVSYLDGAYSIPESWSHQEIPGTPFELPLPASAQVDPNTKIISSHAVYNGGQFDYFLFFLQKIENAHSIDEYVSHLCYTFSGQQEKEGPFGRDPNYELKGSKEANGIQIFEIQEDCSLDSITSYVLVYGEEVYRVGVFDDGLHIDFDLMYTALFNIRPIENTPAIQYLLDHGIASGYPDGTFRPNDPINRAEFTKIIMNAVFDEARIGECPVLSSVSPFSDVQADDWFMPYTCTARRFGIVHGHPDGTFRPADKINTAEAAKIVAKAFELTTEEPGTDPWFQPYMQAIRDIDALPSSAQDPAYLLTRGEVAEIIYRVMTSAE